MQDNNTASQRSLIERSRELAQAAISINKQDRPQSVFRIELDLSKERDQYEPFPINFPFTSILVAKCTDPSATINVKPITNDEHQDFFPIGLKDSWTTSEVIPKAFLHWPKQIGKMTLIVFTDAKFSSGSQLSLTAGGVSISDGTTAKGPFAAILVAGVASEIAPQNLSRKMASLQNRTGADIYIGADNTVNSTTKEGIKIPDDGFIEWRNTGALFAYSVSGGKVTRLEEE